MKVIAVSDIKKALIDINRKERKWGGNDVEEYELARERFITHLEFISGIKIITQSDPDIPKKHSTHTNDEIPIMEKGINQRNDRVQIERKSKRW